MDVYLVALARPSDEAWEDLREHYPNRFQVVSQTMAVVAPDGVATPATVRESIGIDVSPESPSGIVVKLGSEHCSGVLPGKVVDWIRAAER